MRPLRVRNGTYVFVVYDWCFEWMVEVRKLRPEVGFEKKKHLLWVIWLVILANRLCVSLFSLRLHILVEREYSAPYFSRIKLLLPPFYFFSKQLYIVMKTTLSFVLCYNEVDFLTSFINWKVKFFVTKCCSGTWAGTIDTP